MKQSLQSEVNMHVENLNGLCLSFLVTKDNVENRFDIYFDSANVCAAEKSMDAFSGHVQQDQSYIEGTVNKECTQFAEMLKDHTVLEISGEIRTKEQTLDNCHVISVASVEEKDNGTYLKLICTNPYPHIVNQM